MKQSDVPLADIMITDMETDFVVKLYEAVERLVFDKQKVSLIRLSKTLNLSTTELYDYIDLIIEFEKRLNTNV
jgi:hypothetical protein